MREIMFRGKRIEYGEWVYGYLIGDNVIAGNVIKRADGRFDTSFHFEVRPETVGQYTGLKDRKGVEIYEGDILEVFCDCDWHESGCPHLPEKAQVLWDEDSARFDLHDMAGGFHAEEFEGYMTDSFVIIGNIYENLELLERRS